MLRVITTYILLIGLCLTSVVANETEVKSAEFIFKAEVTGLNKQWGVDEGDPVGKTAILEGWRVVCIAMLKSPEFHLY